MPRENAEYWNRQISLTAIFSNAGWSLVFIFRSAPLIGVSLLILNLVENTSPALVIYITKELTDAVIGIAGHQSSGFAQLAPLLIAYAITLVATRDVCLHLRDTLNLRLRQKLTFELTRIYMEKCISVPLAFYEMSESYDQLNRAAQPGEKVYRLFFAILQFTGAVVQATTVTALFWPVSRVLVLFLLVTFVIEAALSVKRSQRFMRFTYGQTEDQRRASYISSLLTGRQEQKEIRVFRLTDSLSTRWRSLRQDLRSSQLQEKKRDAYQGLPALALRNSVVTGAAAFLVAALRRHTITPGAFVALFQGVRELSQAAYAVGFFFRELHIRATNVGYVRQFLAIPAEVAFIPNALPFPCQAQRFCLNDVSFTYPNSDRPVLKHIRLSVATGETVALVGENGAGKTTLVKLLLGLYRPTSGTITVDDTDIAKFDQEEYRKHVSAAFQDYFNFEFKVAASLAVGCPAAFYVGTNAAGWPVPDLTRVEAAATKGGAAEIIARLPQGFDTPIGRILDDSVGLSGGEWQRIALSRALLPEPALLVLDEPTAALDPKVEAEIYKRFIVAQRNRAVLLISHRLGSARLADRIVVLSHGRIIAEGTHESLLQAGGLYADMWKEQAQWYQ